MTKTRNATTATKMICMTSQSKIHAHARSVIQTRRRHRSEEHTSELQSLRHLVCRLLLESYGDHRDLHSFPTRRSSDLTATKMICMTSQSKIHAHARSVIQTRRRHNESDGPDGAADILVDSWRSLCSA